MPSKPGVSPLFPKRSPALGAGTGRLKVGKILEVVAVAVVFTNDLHLCISWEMCSHESVVHSYVPNVLGRESVHHCRGIWDLLGTVWYLHRMQRSGRYDWTSRNQGSNYSLE